MNMRKACQFLLLIAFCFSAGAFAFHYCMNIFVSYYEAKLKRHGQLDKLTMAECRFVKNQKQSNVSFFKNDLAHLRDLDDKLKKLIFRHKELERTMTYEWAAVREQTMLLEQANLTEEEHFTALEICEQLSKCITKICELTDEQQSILLYWENVKNERMEQKKKLLDKLYNNSAVVSSVSKSPFCAQCNNNTKKTDKNL
jgi:hypothetical protein